MMHQVGLMRKILFAGLLHPRINRFNQLIPRQNHVAVGIIKECRNWLNRGLSVLNLINSVRSLKIVVFFGIDI
jgi:hypothetical protein